MTMFNVSLEDKSRAMGMERGRANARHGDCVEKREGDDVEGCLEDVFRTDHMSACNQLFAWVRPWSCCQTKSANSRAEATK